MVAKMFDIPAVLLRTDFRKSGNQPEDGDPWYLMLSGYPRSKKVAIGSFALYKKCKSEKIEDQINSFESEIAKSIIEALDEVCKLPPLFKGNKEDAKNVIQWVIKLIGGTLNTLVTDDDLDKIIDHKFYLGLI